MLEVSLYPSIVYSFAVITGPRLSLLSGDSGIVGSRLCSQSAVSSDLDDSASLQSSVSSDADVASYTNAVTLVVPTLSSSNLDLQRDTVADTIDDTVLVSELCWLLFEL